MPVTLAEAKVHLRVAADDTDEDALIETYIAAATAHAESFMGRALIDQTFDYYIDAFPARAIELPRSPLLEVIEVEGDGAAFTDYLVDYASEPGRIYLTSSGSWPTTTGLANVGRVRFRAGYVDMTGSPTGDVPQDIRAAIFLIIGTLYAVRETIIVGQAPAIVPWSAEQLLRRARVETSMA